MQVIKKLNFQKKVETAHDTKPKSENQSVTPTSQISDVDTTSTHIVVSINWEKHGPSMFLGEAGVIIYIFTCPEGEGNFPI